MRNFVVLMLMLIGTARLAFPQQLNQFKYVQVPESFEFLNEENQYRLNELTVFLLEKEGFEVFYGEEIPAGIDFCDVLQANVSEDSGLFTTRLILTLKTCSGTKVFVSEKGTSREKAYKKAYHEALRNAFTSLEEVGYSYTGQAVATAAAPDRIEEPVTEDVSLINTNREEEGKTSTELRVNEAVADSLHLRNGGTAYVLAKSDSGYHLFKGDEKEIFARLIRSGSGSNYIYSSGNIQGNAYFDASGNLVVEYFDNNSGQLVSIHYSLQQ